MDYILQAEKIYKYFEYNLELRQMQKAIKKKKAFNNDLNLICCYIKDFLTLENNGKISNDNNIYNDFVLCFENYKNKNNENHFIDKLLKFSDYYLTLVFENTKDKVLLNTIASVNSCFNIEYYPFLMELMDEYTNKNIDSISYALMLQYITDTVFKNFEALKENTISLVELRNKLKEFASIQNERIAI